MRIFLSFDFDADAAEQLYYKDKPTKISLAKFSVNKGIHRILKLLREFDIKTTFFVPGWVADTYQRIVQQIVQDGHELALHGYMHEKLYEYGYEEERKIHIKALGSLRKFQATVYGFRKPYFEMSINTLKIVAELGIKYDSSLMDNDEPYIMLIGGRKIVELPIYQTLDDWVLFEIEHRFPREVLRYWIYELESAEEEGLSYFSLILHPACIGRAGRIKILRRIIVHCLRRGYKFQKGIEIANNILKQANGHS